MFRLNRLTDYGVVILAQLASRPEEKRSAQLIAESTGVPLPTVAKILNGLARHGVVVSTRGATGGFALARPAGEIKVSDVIQALEGPIALTACVEGSDDNCDVQRLCPMSGSWERVNRALRDALDSVTLAELIVTEIPPAYSSPPAREAAEASR